MGVVAWVVVGVLSLGLLFTVVFSVLSRVAREHQKAALATYPDALHVEAGALFFGQQSRGVTQMRGNGTLILAAAELIFQQWVVDREFRVPYRAIQSIDTPRSFLGKTQGVRLLRVSYQADDGAVDAMAWRVRDVEALTKILERARS